MALTASRILVAYDGSEPAGRALDTAAELTGYGSAVTVLTVAPNGRAGALLDAARERLSRRHVAAATREEAGDPAEAIVAAAAELGSDLIVVGNRGRGTSLGSVSSAVVAAAGCDVLVVRAREP